MSYKSKLIDPAKFYEDRSYSFARKVSVPFHNTSIPSPYASSIARKKSLCTAR